MDLTPLLTNQRIQNLLSAKIVEALQLTLNLSSNEITYSVLNKPAVTMMGLAHIRLQFSKGSQAIVLGTSDKNTFLKIKEHADCQKITEELSKALGLGVESELAANSTSLELKKINYANEELNVLYKRFESNYFLQFKVGTENPLIFEIPILSNIFLTNYMQNELGYGENARILIVDDSKMNRLVLKNFLIALGFHYIDEAGDGRDGISKIYKSLTKFDLVIADWHMPELTGLEMLKEVRSHSECKNTPFILATSEQKKEEVIEALKHKVSGYLIKPYKLDLLIKALKNSNK
jgi:two-component system chemotaxis response regulator CheY